jgi:hypothetical protein
MTKEARMKKLSSLPLLLLLLATSSGPGALAGQAKTVTVINNTSYAMNEFYASSSGAADWNLDHNLLAGQTLASGQSITFTLATGGGGDSGSCDYDLMAVLYGAAEHAYAYQVNACSNGTWTISQSH